MSLARWLMLIGVIGLMAISFGAGRAIPGFKARQEAEALRRERVPDTMRSQHFRSRVSQFRELKSRPTTIMIGDSLTANGNWNEWLGPSVANRGIGSDTALGLLGRIEASTPASAERVFLMIGLNDLRTFQVPPAKVAGWTAQTVGKLKGRQVYLQSVLYTRQPKLNERITALNALNRRLCETGACIYVDLNRTLAPDGILPQDMTYDGRHLAGRGYRLWADAIRPLIAEPAGAH